MFWWTEIGSVANDYNIIGVPTLILLDKEGNIIGVSHRVSDLPVDNLFPGQKIIYKQLYMRKNNDRKKLAAKINKIRQR